MTTRYANSETWRQAKNTREKTMATNQNGHNQNGHTAPHNDNTRNEQWWHKKVENSQLTHFN